MEQWHFRTAQGEFGPVSQPELAALAKSGGLLPTDEVRRAQSDRWVRPSDSLFDAPTLVAFGIDPGFEPLGLAGAAEEYWALHDERISGPFPLNTLHSLLINGQLPRSCMIRCGEGGAWRTPASEWFHPRVVRVPFPLGTMYTFARDGYRLGLRACDAAGVSLRPARVAMGVGSAVVVSLVGTAAVVALMGLGLWFVHWLFS